MSMPPPSVSIIPPRDGTPDLGRASSSISFNSSIPHSEMVGFRPTDRQLPSREISPKTIVDAFVAFILYCNPTYPLDLDTNDLRQAFLTPPKSEGKDFDMFHLCDLMLKYTRGEVETWTQFALDLGVEGPDATKNQSSQKVQQYMVRLKRWMKSMRVDAFCSYLSEKPHPYFTEIPPPSNPHPKGGRAGILPEGDYALRAIDPSFRPKRGRRRNSDVEMEETRSPGTSPSISKSPRFMENLLGPPLPDSAIPRSAHPDGFHDPWAQTPTSTPQNSSATWSAARSGPPSASTAPSHLRWVLTQRPDGQTPVTPHPLSAQTDGEDKWAASASTPSSRKRKRNGPAISSAWNAGSSSGSKPRGRPPANRSIQDGPFGTFPVEPVAQSTRANERSDQGLDDLALYASGQLATPPSAMSEPGLSGRKRLSLQVPAHQGGPVVQLGQGHEGESMRNHTFAHHNPMAKTLTSAHLPTPQSGQSLNSRPIGDIAAHESSTRLPGVDFEILKRVLASDLLRAELIGSPARLTGEEARRLAHVILDRLLLPEQSSCLPNQSPYSDIACFTAATWLGIAHHLPPDLDIPVAPLHTRRKTLKVTRFRTDPVTGYDELLPTSADPDDASPACRVVYDLSWSVGMGGAFAGSFSMDGLVLAGVPPPHDPRAAATMTSTLDIHDLFMKKSFEAVKRMQQEGWAEDTMKQVARVVSDSLPQSSAAAAAAASQRAYPDMTPASAQAENHALASALAAANAEVAKWKSSTMQLEFACKVAQGALQQEKEEMLQKILGVLLEE